MSTATADDIVARNRPMTPEEKKVIIASSAGTIFEWYDFYLYGSLAAIIGAQFFSAYPESTRNIFALLAFAACGGERAASSTAPADVDVEIRAVDGDRKSVV